MSRTILVLLALCVLCTPLAAAQANTSNGTTVDGSVGQVTGQSSCTETMDEYTSLCRSSVDQDAGTVVLVIKSERYQRVTIVDAGKFAAGGQVPSRTVDVQKGRNRIEFPVASTSGKVGLGLTLGRTGTLYSEWVSQPSPLLPGSPDGTDAPTVLIASVLTSVALILAGAWWFRNGKFGGVRRVF